MLRRFLIDTAGAAMVEMSIVIVLLLTLVLGFVDFGYAFYQWNAATKAVQVGARLASISSPVALGLTAEAGAPANLANAGAPVAANTYGYACDYTVGNALACRCTTGTCANTTYSQANFDLILDGDANRPGMLDFFPGLARSEVRIEYIATGLGFWTRPGGAVPTIRVSIVGHPFQFFFLGGLLGFANLTMPSMISTVTGEDLKSTAP
ncbi:MAG TPA: TadE/TadG family type IV pilus assembly protein [Devosia sp.]